MDKLYRPLSVVCWLIIMIAKRYYIENLSIAFPVILSFAGQQLVQVMDTIMVGRLGAVELSAVSLSSAIITNITMIGLGIAMSLTPLVGIHFARNERQQSATLFQNSILLNILMSVLLCLILFAINPLLQFFGQPQSVLDTLDGYYYCVTLSLIPYLIFLSFKQFLEGLGNTFYSMLIPYLIFLSTACGNYRSKSCGSVHRYDF